MTILSGAVMLAASGLFAVASAIASNPGTGLAFIASLVIGVSGFGLVLSGAIYDNRNKNPIAS
jgi:hypothetical protein